MIKKVPKFDDQVLSWIAQNGFVNSRGQPFEWEMHSYLIDPMCDWSPKIAIRKSAQIGFTESFGIMKTLFGAHFYNLSIIYTNTTSVASDVMVSTKVNPIVQNNPSLRTIIDSDKLGEKKIGNSFIFYRGTFSGESTQNKSMSDKAISVTADLNVYDERDRSDQEVIDMFGSRLENSHYAGEWSFSNPSFPGVGTDGMYEKSDQKMWFMKCPHCNHWQYSDWKKLGEEDYQGVPEHWLVDPINKAYICSKCQKKIDDITRMRGQWVAKYPDREISGYWMSQMNYVKHKARDLLYKEETKTKEFFYNMVLGLPYRGTDVVVDRNIILKNINPTSRGKRIGIGVDNGVNKHYVIGDENGLFKKGITKDWDEIEKIFNELRAAGNSVCMVIDPYPYSTTPYKWAEKYKGEVFLAEYSKDHARMNSIEFMKRDRRGFVDIQRTKYFDELIDKFVQREKPISIPERELDDYIKHWDSLSRLEVPDKMGVPRPVWVSSNGVDHFCHATVYQDIALTKVGGGSSGTVNTPLNPSQDSNPAIVIDDKGYSALPSLEELVKGATQNIDRGWPYS